MRFHREPLVCDRASRHASGLQVRRKSNARHFEDIDFASTIRRTGYYMFIVSSTERPIESRKVGGGFKRRSDLIRPAECRPPTNRSGLRSLELNTRIVARRPWCATKRLGHRSNRYIDR